MADMKPKRPAREPVPNKVFAASPASDQVAVPPIPEPPAPVAAIPAPPSVMPQPEAELAPTAHNPAADSLGHPWAVAAEAQAVLAGAAEEFAVAMTSMTRSGFAAAADAAVALLGARTLAEAVEINAGLAQRSTDALVEGVSKLAEIGVKTTSVASRRLLAQFDTGWRAAGG